MENKNEPQLRLITYKDLKEDMEKVLSELSANPNDSRIPQIFSMMILNINQYFIPYAVMMLSNEFIQVVLQIYFEDTFNSQINSLFTSLLEVFNYEMFSDSPTMAIVSQLNDLKVNVPLSPIRKETTPIEKLYDAMRSLESQWKMIKEMKKEDNSIEDNNLTDLTERLDMCSKMLKEMTNVPLAVSEYFNEYYRLLTLFKDSGDNKSITTNENINAFFSNEMEVEDDFFNDKNHKAKKKKKSPYQSGININANPSNSPFSCLVLQEDVSKVEMHKRTFLYINEKLKAEESIDIEFKNYYYPIPNHLFDEIKKHICGFLNCKGGRIYIGIGDNQVVKGIVLNYKSKDIIRNQLVNCTNDFFPKCRMNKVKVLFLPIKTKTNSYIKNLYVIKVVVRQGDQGKLYSVSSKLFCSFFRMPGQCISLSASEIYEEILKRNSDAIDINKIKEDVIGDSVYDDPEPEVDNQSGSNSFAQMIEPQGSHFNMNGKNIKKLFTVKLDNISKNCSEKELDDIFKLTQYCSKKIFANEKGLCLGWAFFNYKTQDDALNAIKLLKDVEIKGKKLEFHLKK